MTYMIKAVIVCIRADIFSSDMKKIGMSGFESTLFDIHSLFLFETR
jgi:hypothetical protein